MELVALAIAVVSIALTVYWIFVIVEVSRIPSWQFDAAGSNKIFWVCVVLFLQIIGALFWLLVRRADVLDAADWPAEDPPADWYIDLEAGALRWWDGFEWTDRYQTWSGARPRL